MKKHIPNLLTLLNLLSGLIALLFAFQEDFKMTLLLVCIGILFDFLDGFAARLLKVQSPLGLQLDSLADMVTSGVVPGVVVFYTISTKINSLPYHFAEYLPLVGFLIPLASAYRLAKFNLDTRQTNSFIGLPTPANALFLISLSVCENVIFPFSISIWVWIAIAFISCYLLNAELPLFALKFKNFSFKNNETRYSFLGIILCLVLIFSILNISLLVLIPFSILVYILLSVFMNLFKKP